MPSAERKPGLSPLLVIFLTVLIDMIGFGIVIPILPLYSHRFGASPWEVGLLLGSFSMMQLIFAPILGRLSDRHGRRPVLFFSILGTALGFLMLGLANSMWMLFLGRIIDGISGGNVSTAQAYVADVTPPEKRSGAMGMLGAAFGLGFVIGPAIGGLMGHYSMEAPFYAAAGLALLNALAIWFFLPESLSPERRTTHLAETSGSLAIALNTAGSTPLGMVMLCSLLSTIGFSLVTALYTLFTEARLGWDVRDNGLMFVYIGILGVIVQGGLLRRLIPRVGEKPLIVLGSVILFISMAVLPINTALPVLILASSGLSIGNSFVTPSLSGLASKSADAQSQGIIMGLMQSTASLGRMLGPMLGGFLLNLDHHNPDLPYGITPYWVAAGLMLLAALAATRLKPAHHDVHIAQAGN